MPSVYAAKHLVRLLTGRSFYLVAAESCTAGLVADALVRIPGASACFWGSFVCYTPQAKKNMLGIEIETLNKYGMVSGETARTMALCALKKSGADVAVSVTGLAGPGGDITANGTEIPAGTVWIATALRSGNAGLINLDTNKLDSNNMDNETAEAEKFHFFGGRNRVRRLAVRKALEQIIKRLNKLEG